MKIQPGDVPKTEADISLLMELTGLNLKLYRYRN